MIALLTLDLHPIFRNNRDIDLALRETLFRAARTGVDVLQIIPGKGTGQLKKRVLAFLAQTHIKKLYVRVETDATNSGRILVHFR
jgi:dsDNA-specific endonuclease/ATPase MutS2